MAKRATKAYGGHILLGEGFAGPDTVASVVEMLGSEDGAFNTGRRSASTAAPTTDRATDGSGTGQTLPNRSWSNGKRSASAVSSSKLNGVPSGSTGWGGSPRSGATTPVSCSYASSAA
ncbi:hypothetical protein FHX80_111033 [Streptomyces brevispora]|uniref:Uncharacterized protein n=1 Tax=Streptomyces brevispora TaxID=887462 RepID=A0A561UTE8_9ACTN|nr:hypothetical protein FHX80_111033 [Streptomyces brevispora]